MKNLFLCLLLILLGASACNKNDELAKEFSQEEMNLFVDKLTKDNIVVTSIEAGEISLEQWSIIKERLNQGMELEDAIIVLSNKSLKKKVKKYFKEFEQYCMKHKVEIESMLEDFELGNNFTRSNSASRNFGNCKQKCEDEYEDCISTARDVSLAAWTGAATFGAGASIFSGGLSFIVGAVGGGITAGATYLVSREGCKKQRSTCLSYCEI